MAGIYLHVPFCDRKCAYCDFYSIANKSLINDFVNSIIKEIEIRKNYFDGESINTIYFGGGTPSILSPDQLDKIISALYKHFTIEKNIELTLEANPDNLTKYYIQSLLAIGFNRLSIGIQSFDDKYLKLMKRKHTVDQAKKAVRWAQDLGLSNISIDLIYGLPDLTIEEWKNNIDEAIKLEVKHISAYHLTIEPNTLFYKFNKKGKLNLPTEEDSIKQFEILKNISSKNGFIHYEISNFALDGFLSLHNTNYWTGVKYLGLGPSAHSYNLTSREWNISNLHAYMEAISQGKLANEIEILTENEKFNDFLITSLRTMWGLNTEKLQIQFDNKFEKHFFKKAKKFIDQNLLIQSDKYYKLSEKGIFISDNIIASLLYV